MTTWIEGDWERTKEVIAGKRPAVENGETWLRHSEDSFRFGIDLEILKGSLSKEQIAEAVGCPLYEVSRHLEHLQEADYLGSTPHQLKIITTNDNIVMFDFDPNSIELDHLHPASALDFDTSAANPQSSQEWTNDEFEATVQEYLWMLGQEKKGSPYNKSEVNERLRKGLLAARTKSSIEFRMQNISAVLEELCLPWIKGYRPRKHVGQEGRDKIKHFLAKLGDFNPDDYLPSDDPEVVEQRVQNLRGKIDPDSVPAGNMTPPQTSATVSRYIRDIKVKASVLAKAGGTCEGCGFPAPFTDSYGEPFLEVHHLRQLRDKGSDTVTNAVALCPNCHRRCHHSSDQTTFIDSIYLKVSRLVRE